MDAQDWWCIADTAWVPQPMDYNRRRPEARAGVKAPLLKEVAPWRSAPALDPTERGRLMKQVGDVLAAAGAPHVLADHLRNTVRGPVAEAYQHIALVDNSGREMAGNAHGIAPDVKIPLLDPGLPSSLRRPILSSHAPDSRRTSHSAKDRRHSATRRGRQRPRADERAPTREEVQTLRSTENVVARIIVLSKLSPAPWRSASLHLPALGPA